MGRHAVVDIAQILRTPPRPPAPDRLPPGQLEHLRDALAQVGLRLDTRAPALERLSAQRALYEPYVNALSLRLRRASRTGRPSGVPFTIGTSAWGRASAAAAGSRDAVEDDHS